MKTPWKNILSTLHINQQGNNYRKEIYAWKSSYNLIEASMPLELQDLKPLSWNKFNILVDHPYKLNSTESFRGPLDKCCKDPSESIWHRVQPPLKPKTVASSRWKAPSNQMAFCTERRNYTQLSSRQAVSAALGKKRQAQYSQTNPTRENM